jgi:hypothetical protein|tara:strand:- start:18 stop:311 length:294 start_codon:yes stop_codon:yes gene_type:complete
MAGIVGYVFCMASVTYNKDGTPRKQGSGRRKGSLSLMQVKCSELTRGLKPDDPVVVGRKWYEDLFKKIVDIPADIVDTPSAASAVDEKIAYKLTTFK